VLSWAGTGLDDWAGDEDVKRQWIIEVKK